MCLSVFTWNFFYNFLIISCFLSKGLTCHSFESQSLPDFDCSESRSGQVSPDLAVEDGFDSFEGEVPVSNSTPTPMFEVHEDGNPKSCVCSVSHIYYH